jgi:hypothetical protein
MLFLCEIVSLGGDDPEQLHSPCGARTKARLMRTGCHVLPPEGLTYAELEASDATIVERVESDDAINVHEEFRSRICAA